MPVALWAGCAFAHGGDAEGAATVYQSLTTLTIFVAGMMYAIGLLRLRRGALRLNANARWGSAAFFAGLLLAWVVAAGPFEQATRESFALHMVQHELLILLVAPLLVEGRPLALWTWALEGSVRKRVRTRLTQTRAHVWWRVFTTPAGATLFHLGALCVWHVPRLFDLASEHAGWHALQHASFLLSALCFWWAMLRCARARQTWGVGIACLFVLMLACGALGALLTFAPVPWYDAYATPREEWVSSALEDQQLGGLVMWIPGGTVYAASALWLAGRALARRRTPPSPRGRQSAATT